MSFRRAVVLVLAAAVWGAGGVAAAETLEEAWRRAMENDHALAAVASETEAARAGERTRRALAGSSGKRRLHSPGCGAFTRGVRPGLRIPLTSDPR
jgi:hypothetical protein